MAIEAWITLLVVAGTVGMLMATRLAPDLVLMVAVTALMLFGVLSPGEALQGFASTGLVTVAVLYVVAAGLVDTGAIHLLGSRLLGRPRTVAAAQLRLMLPVTGLSAFLNNTPVVAMLVPFVEDWCRRLRMPVSKLMIPLSYAAIFGGITTIIGTSTNLIVNGMLIDRGDTGGFGFFEIGLLGAPLAVAGILFLVVTGRWLLPDRSAPLRELEQVREYTLEMLVEANSPLVGRNLEEAGLRNLPGAFLAEIERGGTVLPAVSPYVRLQPGDRLLFVGVVDSVVELVRLRGLVPAPEQLFKLDAPRAERRFFEVVLSRSSPMVGMTIRAGEFRSRYDAVVIAVARNGARIRGKVGDIELRVGDTLLLESRPSFIDRQRNSPDFLLVSEVRDVSLPRHERAWVAIAILLGMVAIATSGLLSMLEAVLVAAGLMLATRCTSAGGARNRVDWSVLVVIGAALGLGQAMSVSGAAGSIAAWWIGLAGQQPWLALAAVYAITSLFTELITNNAAAVLVFPIAEATAQSLGVSLWPFAAVVMIGASASFATPIGYQTNLMVYGPGGYRFTDYVRIGAPLNVLIGVLAVLLAPLIWPFHG
ncbi:MAG: SLC13 family permease [Pseudomonadales bacterium]